jgi:hypothetical protein
VGRDGVGPGSGRSRFGEVGIVGEDGSGPVEEGDGLGEVTGEELAELVHAFELGFDLGLVVVDPTPGTVEAVFGVRQGFAGASDVESSFLDGLGVVGEAGGEEFLFGLGELLGALFDHAFPVGLTVRVEPVPGLDDRGAYVIEDAAGLVAIEDEARAEGIEGFD